MKREINGFIKFSRSESSDCVCCEGKHIYGRGITTELGSEKCIDIHSLILNSLPEDTENKEIKIIIKIK